MQVALEAFFQKVTREITCNKEHIAMYKHLNFKLRPASHFIMKILAVLGPNSYYNTMISNVLPAMQQIQIETKVLCLVSNV